MMTRKSLLLRNACGPKNISECTQDIGVSPTHMGEVLRCAVRVLPVTQSTTQRLMREYGSLCRITSTWVHC
jgi:hypothetical protein